MHPVCSQNQIFQFSPLLFLYRFIRHFVVEFQRRRWRRRWWTWSGAPSTERLLPPRFLRKPIIPSHSRCVWIYFVFILFFVLIIACMTGFFIFYYIIFIFIFTIDIKINLGQFFFLFFFRVKTEEFFDLLNTKVFIMIFLKCFYYGN